MSEPKKRRKKGPAAIGDFESAKRAAEELIRQQREADRLKSERLRAMRLARAASDQQATNDGG
jgi:hypothetical protein